MFTIDLDFEDHILPCRYNGSQKKRLRLSTSKFRSDAL